MSLNTAVQAFAGDEPSLMGVGVEDRVVMKWMIPKLVGACLMIGASAQSHQTPASRAEITRFFIEKPQEESGYETGALHIIYSDGSEVVQTLPPLKPKDIFNAVGFSGVKVAEDRQTLGWEINIEGCCTSYSIPITVVVFRHRHIHHKFTPGEGGEPMVWNWKFVRGGKQVEIGFGPIHGEIGGVRLYDVKTGKVLPENQINDDP